MSLQKVGEILQACKLHLLFRTLSLLDQLYEYKTNKWVQFFQILVEQKRVFFTDAWETVIDSENSSRLKIKVI